MEAPTGKSRGGDLSLAFGLFLFLVAAYSLVATNNMFVSSDEGVNLALVESLAKFGRFDIEQMATLTREIPAEHGVDGLHYSKYGLTQALLSVPFYWLAQAVDGFGIMHTLLLSNAVFTAVAGAFVYLCARRLGYGQGLGIVLALLFGLASPALVYTKRFMSEPVSTLALVATAYFALGARQSRTAQPLLAGLCMGLGGLNKFANFAFAPLFAVYLLLVLEPGPAGAYPLARRLRRPEGWVRALSFALPVVLAVLVAGYYNWVRFGDVLHTGYGPQEGFNVPLWEGLAGLLFSPGKSAFIYFPLLLLLPFWAPRLLRRLPEEGWLFFALVAGHFLLYATWWIWWGGWNWGVRFLIPAWPFAVLLLGDGLRDLRRPAGWAVAPLLVTVLLTAASLFVQLLGVAVDHSVFLASLMPLSINPERLTLVDLAYQPVLNQFRFLTPAYLDFTWLVRGDPWSLDTTAIAWLVGAMAVTAAVLLLAYRQRGRGLLVAGGLVLALLAVAAADFVTLERAYAREDASAGRIVAKMAAQAEEKAALVYLAPRFQTLYSNAAKHAVPTWGTHEEDPLKPASRARLERMVQEYDRIWLITEYAPGERGNGIELWLTGHAFRDSEEWFGPFRVCSYTTARAAAKDFVDLNVKLGEGIELLGYSIEDPQRPRRPGETLNVTLRWRAEGAVKEDYTVFLHLLDAQEQVWGQRDSQPGSGFAPTSSWQPGEVLDDRYGVPVAADAPAGEYRLELGMYLLATGERLPVLDAAGNPVDTRVILPVTVQVGE